MGDGEMRMKKLKEPAARQCSDVVVFGKYNNGSKNNNPIIYNTPAVSYIATKENVSFSNPATLIVTTIAPVYKGMRIPFTRPMN